MARYTAYQNPYLQPDLKAYMDKLLEKVAIREIR